MRSWSYKQATESAEKQISDLAESAKKRPDDESVRLYRAWAFGVYLGWEHLTVGWQKDGDNARLQAMADAVGT
jgi:hypothetical protein